MPDKITPLTTGDIVEARVAQVWFWEGYYARSGVDLQNEYGAELIQVTDLDLIATAFGPNLELRRIIGESKSGTGKSAPKPLDRIVWLNGLQQLVGASNAELTIAAKATPRSRELGRRLNVKVQSLADLAAREAQLGMTQLADSGSQGPTAVEIRKRVQKLVSADLALAANFKFLTSTVWFADPFSAIKQTIGVIARLSDRWTPAVEDNEYAALSWIFSEALSVFAFNLTAMAAEVTPLDDASYISYVSDRLSDGVVSASAMRQLSPRFDKFVQGLLSEVGAPAKVITEAMGSFTPSPPEYSNSLAELALRVKRSGSGSLLPRQIDYVVHERLARGRKPRREPLARLGSTSDTPFAAISAFLRRYANLPPTMYEALTGALDDSESSARSVHTERMGGISHESTSDSHVDRGTENATSVPKTQGALFDQETK